MKQNLTVFLLFLFINVSGQTELKEEVKSKNNALKMAVSKLAADPAIQNGSFGFYAVKVENMEVLAFHNPNQSLIPASTMKAVTTATALMAFGSGHKFKTFIEYDGTISPDSILNGNLFITGGGDPSLGSGFFYDGDARYEFLNHWYDAVKKAGIKKVNGAVIADSRIFSGEMVPEGWTWGDMGNYYGAGASGLSIFDNLYEIEFSTGKVGEKAKVKNIKPAIPYLELINEVKSSNTTGDNSCIYGGPNTSQRIIRGHIPSGRSSFIVKGSIPDPPLLAAITFSEFLTAKGIQIIEKPKSVSENEKFTAKKRRLLEYSSPGLDSIVYWVNMKSLNPWAETLTNHIGLANTGTGDTPSGSKAVINYWKAQGLDTKGMFILDGSGLSRSNGITARQITEIMARMAGSGEFNAFYNSLPIAGRTGSISGSCRGTAAENNLRAKSGYLNRVRSYTGYVQNKKGELVAFAMIINNYTCTAAEGKSKLEKLMVALAESE
ncbi:MAG: D-alanyl-D-alanine carboxypeptidase/D-alanyl-D-alanine-endopeptidase [Bacteroidetes bacterium]|nr:D-alanyl-D-alanine carboxypeptidase/D-alanyl-D-alanine-endopeptidase [Bacteroidota bacterium]